MGTRLMLKNSVEIDASPAKVWDTLVNPVMTRKYMFDCEALSDWKAGSELLWKGATDGKVYVKGNIVEIEYGKILRYTVFDPNGGMKDIPSNYLTVTYALLTQDGKTLLTVSQGDYSVVENGQKRYEDTVNGWGTVLQKIKEIAEQK